MQQASMRLRAARREEGDRLLAFYQANPDPFLLPRPFGEFAKAIERGQFFIVEEGHEIVAASGIFDYGEVPPFVELAETFVAPPVRGFGIQDVFFRLRTASVVVTQGPSVGITTAVNPRNQRSLATATKQGFKPWTMPIEEAFQSCATCPLQVAGRRCCCDFYVLPADGARLSVARLMADSDTGSITLAQRGGGSINLECVCALFRGELRAALEEFAAGAEW